VRISTERPARDARHRHVDPDAAPDIGGDRFGVENPGRAQPAGS